MAQVWGVGPEQAVLAQVWGVGPERAVLAQVWGVGPGVSASWRFPADAGTGL